MLKTNQKYKNNYLIKQLPKATAFVNKKMQVVFASDKWVSDFNFINDTVLGTKITFLFKGNNKNWHQIFKKCLNEASDKISIEAYFDDEGHTKWFEVQSIPWHDENENVIGTILQTENVTERIKNETKLEKLQIISNQMSEAADIGFWEYNTNNDEISWCDKTKKIHEVSPDYIPNIISATNFYDKGYDRNTIMMSINNAVLLETNFLEKLQLTTAKGNKIWVIVSGKPLYTNNKLTGIIGTIQNINVLNNTETKHRENEHLLRTLIDSLPLNVFIKDLESRKVLVNKSEMAHYGLTAENQMIGKDDFFFLDKETAENSRKDDLTVMRDLKPVLGKEFTKTYKDGTERTFLTSKIPLIDSDGQAYGLVGFSMDISERIKKEQELRNLIKIASTQNEKLIAFAHIVSHNLRSHSANFSMLLKLYKEDESAKEKETILNMLEGASDNLLETLDNLNDVISITKTQNHKKEKKNLYKKVNEISEKLSSEFINNKVTVINEISENSNVWVVPEFIDSILTNFMTNGIKYRSLNRKSFLKFSVSKEKNYTILTIEDNGLGIDLNKHGDKLFGMYKTFHDHKDAKGIGLYITKNQIEAMRGKVTVSSTVDKGTVFNIYFHERN